MIKHDCPDCGSIASVYWLVAVPEIWRCSACTTLLEPKEIQKLSQYLRENTESLRPSPKNPVISL